METTMKTLIIAFATLAAIGSTASSIAASPLIKGVPAAGSPQAEGATYSELAAKYPGLDEAAFSAADRNHDGRLNAIELSMLEIPKESYSSNASG
jgi:hypothetical protein